MPPKLYMPTHKKRFRTIDEYINHVGFYPIPSGTEAFKKELSPYKGAKSSVRFPIETPVRYDLVKKIVIFRMREDQEKKK